MMKNIHKVMRELIEERGNVCEVEKCRNRADDAHHVFYRQRIKFPQLNDPINLQLVCRKHHGDGTANSLKNKAYFWNVQRKRGYDIKKWKKGLPLKIKHI